MYKNKYDMDTLLSDLSVFFEKRFPNIKNGEGLNFDVLRFSLFWGPLFIIAMSITYTGFSILWTFYFIYFIIWLLATWWENKLRDQKNNRQKWHEEIDEDEIYDQEYVKDVSKEDYEEIKKNKKKSDG